MRPRENSPRNSNPSRSLQPWQVAGWFGDRPWVGLGMVLLGGLAFQQLAAQIKNKGPLVTVDETLAKTLHEKAVHASPFTTMMMKFGFYIGRELPGIIAVVLGAYYLWKKYTRELLMLILAFGGSGVWWSILYPIFNRPRPKFKETIWLKLNTGSYPSGHCITSMASYGFLAYQALTHIKNRFWRWLLVSLSALATGFIGFTRLFLGDHYLTDVLGGYSFGIAWAGVVFTVLERLFTGKKDEDVKKE